MGYNDIVIEEMKLSEFKNYAKSLFGDYCDGIEIKSSTMFSNCLDVVFQNGRTVYISKSDILKCASKYETAKLIAREMLQLVNSD